MSRSSEGVKEPQARRIGTSDGDLLALLGAMTRIKVSSRDTLGTFLVGEARLRRPRIPAPSQNFVVPFFRGHEGALGIPLCSFT